MKSEKIEVSNKKNKTRMHCEVCQKEFTSKTKLERHELVCQFCTFAEKQEDIVPITNQLVSHLILKLQLQEKRIVQLERALRRRIVSKNRLDTLPIPKQTYTEWKRGWPISMKKHFYAFLEHSLKDCIFQMIVDIQSTCENPVEVPFQCLEAEITKTTPIKFYYYYKNKWHQDTADKFLEDLMDKVLEWLEEWSENIPEDSPNTAHFPQPIYIHLSEKLQLKSLPKEWKTFVFEQFCREEV